MTTRGVGRRLTCQRTWLAVSFTLRGIRASRRATSHRASSASGRWGKHPMSETTLTIDPSEMASLVETLGKVGEQPEGGIIRHVYDTAWRVAREQVTAWMADAGFQVREDAVGNLFGRIEGDSPRTVLTGSHI